MKSLSNLLVNMPKFDKPVPTGLWYDGQSHLSVNKRLDETTDQDRLAFLQHFLVVWSSHPHDPAAALAEMQTVFGTTYDTICGRPLMFTLTEDKQQLRGWYGPFAAVSKKDHVDSMGKNLLFQVWGSPKGVWHFAETLLGETVMAKPERFYRRYCMAYIYGHLYNTNLVSSQT